MKLPDHNIGDARGPYRVPEGYFNDLRHTIVEKAQSEPADNSWIGALGRLLGFAGGFAFLAALAAGFFYLIPETKDIDKDIDTVAVRDQSQSLSLDEFAEIYDISEDDILTYYYLPDTSTIDNSAFAQAVDDYLAVYGVDYINE